MGSIGIWQVILVLAIVLIIFGAGKLPRVMGDVAKGVKNFKQGMKDEDTSDDADKTKTIEADAQSPMSSDSDSGTAGTSTTGTSTDDSSRKDQAKTG
ncbi:MAG: twin-arginine translocase TatA/TatE family subunit [Azospirillaceae bacterium]